MVKPLDYILFFSKPFFFGIASFVFFLIFINPYNADFKSAEVAVNTYALNIFVGWTFFSAFLLLRADEEWKRVDEAIRENNFKRFKIEIAKKMAISVKVTYLIISAFVVFSYYLFHYESMVLAFVIVFGTSFIVGLMKIVLWDLDTPIDGLINVEDIPKSWLQKMKSSARK